MGANKRIEIQILHANIVLYSGYTFSNYQPNI